MLLRKELESHGVEMAADEFEDLLQETLAAMFPARTGEQIMYEPNNESGPYCKAIRTKVGKKLPDEMILRRLTNIRKKGAEAA